MVHLSICHLWILSLRRPNRHVLHSLCFVAALCVYIIKFPLRHDPMYAAVGNDWCLRFGRRALRISSTRLRNHPWFLFQIPAYFWISRVSYGMKTTETLDLRVILCFFCLWRRNSTRQCDLVHFYYMVFMASLFCQSQLIWHMLVCLNMHVLSLLL